MPIQIPTIMANYIILGLFLLVVILLIWTVVMHMRLSRLMRSGSMQSLEDTFTKMIRDVDRLKEYGKSSSLYLQEIEERMRKSIQTVPTLRYNPFKGLGDGGNSSFASAFLNEHGDGVILSSLHARDRVTMFAKPVRNFESEHELSEEEQQVVTEAKEFYSHSNPKS